MAAFNISGYASKYKPEWLWRVEHTKSDMKVDAEGGLVAKGSNPAPPGNEDEFRLLVKKHLAGEEIPDGSPFSTAYWLITDALKDAEKRYRELRDRPWIKEPFVQLLKIDPEKLETMFFKLEDPLPRLGLAEEREPEDEMRWDVLILNEIPRSAIVKTIKLDEMTAEGKHILGELYAPAKGLTCRTKESGRSGRSD